MPSLSEEQGLSGLSYHTGGYVDEELLPQLHGRQAITTYREMRDNDPIIGAIMFCIDMIVRQVEWSVEQGDADEEDAEFLEGCMEDMSHSWGDFVSEVMSMVPFGFSFHEIVYKRRQGPQKETSKIPSSRFNDGKIGWRKLPMRAQETLDHWEFDDNGGLEAFVQKPPPDYKDRVIPIVKGLLFRTTTYKNNPEGRSLLRSAYRPWYFKKRVEEIEGVGIERDLAGFPVIDMPAEILLGAQDNPEYQKIVNAWMEVGKNIRRDKQEFVMIPSFYDDAGHKLFDLRLLSSGGARTFDTSGIITRYSQHIAMTVLADFILLGHEKVGSFALSSDKTDLFAVALGTLLDVIADVMNRFAVPRLFALNGMNMENLPEIKHGDIESQNLADLANFISSLVGAGVPLFPDEDLENHLRGIAKLPEKSDEAKRAQEAATDQNNNNEDEVGGQGTGGDEGSAGGPPQRTSNAPDVSGGAQPNDQQGATA